MEYRELGRTGIKAVSYTHLLQGLSQLVAAGGAAVAAVNAAQFCGNFLDGKSFYQDADSFKIAGAAVDESNIMDLAVNDVIIYLLRAGAAEMCIRDRTGDPSYGDDEFCKPLFADHSCADSDHWL